MQLQDGGCVSDDLESYCTVGGRTRDDVGRDGEQLGDRRVVSEPESIVSVVRIEPSPQNNRLRTR